MAEETPEKEDLTGERGRTAAVGVGLASNAGVRTGVSWVVGGETGAGWGAGEAVIGAAGWGAGAEVVFVGAGAAGVEVVVEGVYGLTTVGMGAVASTEYKVSRSNISGSLFCPENHSSAERGLRPEGAGG